MYLCGPMNFCNDEEMNEWRQYITSKKDVLGFDVKDPTVRDYRDATVNGMTPELASRIVTEDLTDIHRSDVLLVKVNPSKPSVGTMMEIVYGRNAGLLVVVMAPSYYLPSPWLMYHSDVILYQDANECIEDKALNYIMDWASKNDDFR